MIIPSLVVSRLPLQESTVPISPSFNFFTKHFSIMYCLLALYTQRNEYSTLSSIFIFSQYFPSLVYSYRSLHTKYLISYFFSSLFQLFTILSLLYIFFTLYEHHESFHDTFPLWYFLLSYQSKNRTTVYFSHPVSSF